MTILRRLDDWTRPVDPEVRRVLAERWAALPEGVRTPAQVLGRHAVGCEGTHGVFPKCDLACTPCYHSRDANRVRVDGAHTVAQVEAQMAYARSRRGPRAHAQLIGGEVTLLPPEDHAAALQVMHAHGREPMSMTHGDFDYDYLRTLAVGPDGRPRLARLSFAAHFDMLMFGRRGIERPPDEAALDPYRRRYVAMFRRLRAETGVRSYLAHNMTVTPRNVGQVAAVVRANRGAGFDMFSFQPAAYVGDDRRWHDEYRAVTPDAVWAEIERGAGAPLPYQVVQMGDVRCNRTAWGFYVGERWHGLLDPASPADLRVRDEFFAHLGGVNFGGTPLPQLAAKLARVALTRPRLVAVAAGWAARTVRRAGGVPTLLRHRPRPVTFVMHQFMDASVVAPAWAAMERGEVAAEPEIRATQERLQACVYSMAHPETGRMVPACVQHSVLDPQENAELRRQLPILSVTTRRAR